MTHISTGTGTGRVEVPWVRVGSGSTNAKFGRVIRYIVPVPRVDYGYRSTCSTRGLPEPLFLSFHYVLFKISLQEHYKQIIP